MPKTKNSKLWRLRVAEEWQIVTSRGARSGKPEDYTAWAKRAHPSVTGALVQPHVLGMGSGRAAHLRWPERPYAYTSRDGGC